MAERLSFSQLNSWAGCGERYRLERILRVPQVPAWNLIGGSSLHEITENYDFNRLGVAKPQHDFEEIFERRTEEAEQEHGIDRSEFRATGRASKDWPEKENADWWLANGPAMFNRWITFTNNAPWDIWITPDGTPAIELEFTLGLQKDNAGFPTLEVKGFIDRVFVNHVDNSLIVFDLKTGASKQFSNRQLGTYRVGLADRFGVTASWGTFWDARSGTTSPLGGLNEYTRERIEWQYGTVRHARANGIYIANPGPICSSCSVRDYCLEVTPDATSRVRPPWVSEEDWNDEEGAA